MGRSLKKGAGWRLGWDPDPTRAFQGLVGTDDWAVELTAAEFIDFCRLLVQLAETVTSIAPELMAEERISIEAESDLVWLEIEGFADCYSLRMLLLTQRNIEGNWPAEVVSKLVMIARIFHQTKELPI
ncbi:hypothetical protein NIES970_03880 [[Synechococcus] sp. NIES-970]|uniref:DUF1818 family protein n=1 Tax=Picosynechococcus sp. NKBG15041c TaxID=1407650 RepID=UPI00040A0B11|nr:DUF1818 family protein [Picosynechococcus sp. NKBG15041c]BAW95482.1 hypothetical protein NIES970_03880 [[Synechococcus] sp. NIES-970]